MKQKTRLLLILTPLLASGCGQKMDMIDVDRIHVWHESLTCKQVVYPIPQLECVGQHLDCVTHRDGTTDCLISFRGSELEERL